MSQCFRKPSAPGDLLCAAVWGSDRAKGALLCQVTHSCSLSRRGQPGPRPVPRSPPGPPASGADMRKVCAQRTRPNQTHVVCHWRVPFGRPPGAARTRCQPESNQENGTHTPHVPEDTDGQSRDLLDSLKNPEISSSRKSRGQRVGRRRWQRPEDQGHSWCREEAGSRHCPAAAGAAQTDSRRCKDLPTPRIGPRPRNPSKFVAIKFVRKPRPALTAASIVICWQMEREVHPGTVASDLPLTEEWAPGSGAFSREGRL